MTRPKIKAALFFSLVVGVGLVASGQARAADVTTADASQNHDAATTVITQGGQAVVDSSVQASGQTNVDVTASSNVTADTTTGNDQSGRTQGGGTDLAAKPESTDSGGKVAMAGQPEADQSSGSAQAKSQFAQSSPGSSRLMIASASGTSAAAASSHSTAPASEPNPSGPRLPSGGLQQLSTIFNVTLPFIKNWLPTLAAAVKHARPTGWIPVSLAWLTVLVLGIGYADWLRRSGYRHGARSDVPVAPIFQFVTPKKVSSAYAGMAGSSLFSGVSLITPTLRKEI